MTDDPCTHPREIVFRDENADRIRSRERCDRCGCEWATCEAKRLDPDGDEAWGPVGVKAHWLVPKLPPGTLFVCREHGRACDHYVATCLACEVEATLVIPRGVEGEVLAEGLRSTWRRLARRCEHARDFIFEEAGRSFAERNADVLRELAKR